jgi:hypothetical protein
MKKNKFETKTAFKKRVKKRAKIEEKIFIGILVLGVIYYLFFEDLSFGEDYRYTLYVFWLPTILGFVFSVKYSFIAEYWRSLLIDLKKEKYFLMKIFYPLFLVAMTFMYSVIMFWMPSNIIWDSINKIESITNEVEVYNLPVEKFYKGRGRSYRDKICFRFKNQSESIQVSSEFIKPYLDKNPKNYRIKLKVRKGIWNYYVYEDFDIL